MPGATLNSPNKRPTIIRGPKFAHYFVVDNALFSDERLSWEARGLMGYLLSKPDDWKVRLYDLVARGPAGVHKIQRILRELEAAGYLRRVRLKRSNGAFDWETTVCEVPILSPIAANPGKFARPHARIPRGDAK
jgi:hypothetical protein